MLLLVPLLFLYFWRGRASGFNGLVRLVLLLILVLIAAVPLARIGGQGVDVVVIADLSRSMPEGSRQRELEIIQLLEDRRARGDRVGIVTYGRDARIERLPEELGKAAAFVQEIDPDGSDLGGAIALAASLIPRERPGRLIVLSDGEANGTPVVAAAHEVAARGIPIDFRGITRSETADIAVESLDLPGTVDEREPFNSPPGCEATAQSRPRLCFFATTWKSPGETNLSARRNAVDVPRPDRSTGRGPLSPGADICGRPRAGKQRRHERRSRGGAGRYPCREFDGCAG